MNRASWHLGAVSHLERLPAALPFSFIQVFYFLIYLFSYPPSPSPALHKSSPHPASHTHASLHTPEPCGTPQLCEELSCPPHLALRSCWELPRDFSW